MSEAIDKARQYAYYDSTILIEGESGTGKELFAQAIHAESPRQKGPFVAVNCASLPRDLIESELFGYEKGSFTGALREGNPGKFELADHGTLFLDEIGEMPLEFQAKHAPGCRERFAFAVIGWQRREEARCPRYFCDQSLPGVRSSQREPSAAIYTID